MSEKTKEKLGEVRVKVEMVHKIFGKIFTKVNMLKTDMDTSNLERIVSTGLYNELCEMNAEQIAHRIFSSELAIMKRKIWEAVK